MCGIRDGSRRRRRGESELGLFRARSMERYVSNQAGVLSISQLR